MDDEEKALALDLRDIAEQGPPAGAFWELVDLHTGVSSTEEEYAQQALGFLKAVLDAAPRIQAIIVHGYTPYFNDGDLCRHSHSVYLVVDGYRWDEAAEYLGVDAHNLADDEYIEALDDLSDDELKAVLASLPNPSAEARLPSTWMVKNRMNGELGSYEDVMKLLTCHDFESICRGAWDTNFNVIAYRDGDEVKILEREYEQEY